MQIQIGQFVVEARRPRLGRAYAVMGYVADAAGTPSAAAALVAACWPDSKWGRPVASMLEYGDAALDAMIAEGVPVTDITTACAALVPWVAEGLPRTEAIEDRAGN